MCIKSITAEHGEYEKSLGAQRKVIPPGDLGKTLERVTAPPPPTPPGLKMRRSSLAEGEGEHSRCRENGPRQSCWQAQEPAGFAVGQTPGADSAGAVTDFPHHTGLGDWSKRQVGPHRSP